jgi:hypothetical protein
MNWCIIQAIIYANKRNWLSNTGMEQLISRHEVVAISTSTRRTNSNDHLEDAPLLENYQDDLEPIEDHSIFRVLLMVFALSLHAVFEGLSVGMMTDVNLLIQVILLFFKVIYHIT